MPTLFHGRVRGWSMLSKTLQDFCMTPPSGNEAGLRSLKKFVITTTFLTGALIAVLITAAMVGSERLDFGNLSPEHRAILFDIRLPRVLLAACVGGSLAVAGAALQALLRNPLAEPYLLGVSNGAALGTMLAFVFFEQFFFARPLFAFAGAAASTFV